MVAIDQNAADLRELGVYTKDHRQMIEWLKEKNISSIAMESTDNYW